MHNSKLTFLLMAGLPGAGKSTLSRALGCDLHWHVIDKDKLKEAFLDEGLENEAAGYAAYEEAFATAHKMLSKEQTSVILDTAALQRFILARAQDIAAALSHVQLKIILCMADRDLRNERLRKRPPQLTTIHVDPPTIADYYKIFRHLPDTTFFVYTNRPLEECLVDIKIYLDT